jgi:glycosyltransferase involved in cell wall biosynthesis
VVVSPSRYDSYSLVALEAMACGRPVIVSSACGIAEWLASERPELVVPPDDPDALARALEPFLADIAFAKRLGTVLRGMVEARHQPLIVAQERLGLYTELLAGHRAVVPSGSFGAADRDLG